MKKKKDLRECLRLIRYFGLYNEKNRATVQEQIDSNMYQIRYMDGNEGIDKVFEFIRDPSEYFC